MHGQAQAGFFSEPWSCLQLKTGQCKKIPDELKLKSELCKINLKALKCEEELKNDFDALARLRSCDVEDICSEELNPLHESLSQIQGCSIGVGEVAVDTYEAVKEIPEQITIQNLKKTYNKIIGINYSDYFRIEKVKNSINSLYSASIKALENKKIKLECYDSVARQELICYGLFSIISPGAAVGLVAKSPRLASIVKKAELISESEKSTDTVIKSKKVLQIENLKRKINCGVKPCPDYFKNLHIHENAKEHMSRHLMTKNQMNDLSVKLEEVKQIIADKKKNDDLFGSEKIAHELKTRGFKDGSNINTFLPENFNFSDVMKKIENGSLVVEKTSEEVLRSDTEKFIVKEFDSDKKVIHEFKITVCRVENCTYKSDEFHKTVPNGSITNIIPICGHDVVGIAGTKKLAKTLRDKPQTDFQEIIEKPICP